MSDSDDRKSAKTPQIEDYLDIRTAAPTSWSPDATRVLISTNESGSAQIHRLDLGADMDAASAGLPAPTDALPAVTVMDDPIGAGYLPRAVGGDGHTVLFAADDGGNERTQLHLGNDRPSAPYTEPAVLADLIVDDAFIHRPGGVTREGSELAYATNSGDGVAFDTHIRNLDDGADVRVFASGGWTNPAGFSPDGRYLAISEVTTEPGDNRTYLLDRSMSNGEVADSTHSAVIELAAHTGSAMVGSPAWLPDTSAFFFATDVGEEFAAIARGTPDGTWDYVARTGWPTGCAVDWQGRHLLVAWNEAGYSRLALRDPHTGETIRQVPLPGDGVVSNVQFSRDGTGLVYSYSSPLVPGDAWHVDLATDALTRLTYSRCPVDPATFVDAELAHATAPDGLEIPLFVFRSSAPRSAPQPVVVVIHGGPESQYRPTFAALTQYLVAQGFAVIAPNVRGSTGYGRTYQHLDDVERRYDAIRDLAAVHDWIAAQPELDETRSALYGASYGGYMVLAGLTFQPERWAAGVDIVGMSNLVTFLERTAVWRRAFREREYGTLAEHRDLLEDLSPITHVDQLRAPVCIVHGANDPRVPLHEAEQIHEVLTQRGVRSELLVYEDEGHGLAKLRNRKDAYPRIAQFLHDTLTHR